MKRRTFIGAGSGLALIPLVTACGDAESTSETKGDGKITYWLWQDDATDPTWQKLADEFNKSQDEVSVTLETIPLDQYQNQLTTAAMNGTGPDAARCKDWWLGQFAPQGAISDLTKFVNDWGPKNDVVEGLWSSGRLPGKEQIYMLPHQYVTLYMYYRKDLFEAAGLSAPETQEDFLTAAERLTNDGQYGFDVRGGAGGQDQWLAWMFAGGARIVDDEGNIVINNERAVEVNQRYLSIVNDLHAAPPGSITAAFADVKKNFASGLTAMMIHHPGSLKEMKDKFGDDLGVVPVPSDDSPKATLGSMSGNVILAGSKQQEAAWKWISWLTTKDPMLTMSTSPQGQLPVLQSVIEDPAFSSDPDMKVALDAIPNALTWPALKGVATLAGKDWNPTIQQAFQGELTSQEALDKMANVLKG